MCPELAQNLDFIQKRKLGHNLKSLIVVHIYNQTLSLNTYMQYTLPCNKLSKINLIIISSLTRLNTIPKRGGVSDLDK